MLDTDTICPKMGGKKCAGPYCDMWNNYEQKCWYAILAEDLHEATKEILKWITLMHSKKDHEEENVEMCVPLPRCTMH